MEQAKKNQDGDYLLSYINCVWILNSKQKKSLLLLLLLWWTKKVVTIQTIGEIHDAKKLTHQPSMWLTTTIKQFNQQQHQIMKVIIMCFLSVGSSICPGGCPPPCSKKLNNNNNF